MNTYTLIALLVCISIPVFAEFEHLRARRDIESSGEGSGMIESSGEHQNVESSGEGSGEGSGEASGEAPILLESSGDGSGAIESSVQSDAKEDKSLTGNEFAVIA